MQQNGLSDHKKDAIWWRPLSIDGIEGITGQVDSIIKQFQEFHASTDAEAAKQIPDFLKAIDKRIHELSNFYKENRGDERAILFELQSLKLRQLFRGWNSHAKHNCLFADVKLDLGEKSLSSAEMIENENQLITGIFSPMPSQMNSRALPQDLLSKFPEFRSGLEEVAKRAVGVNRPRGHSMTISARPRTNSMIVSPSKPRGTSLSGVPTRPRGHSLTLSPASIQSQIADMPISNSRRNSVSTKPRSNSIESSQSPNTGSKKLPTEQPNKNFIKENIEAFKATNESKKWSNKLANQTQNKSKPLYFWENDNYSRKSPPQLIESATPSHIPANMAEEDIILAEFQILMTKEEVEELLHRREQLIRQGYISALQTYPYQQKNIGKLAYSSPPLTSETKFLHSATPYLDTTYVRDHLLHRPARKDSWVSPQQFWVSPKTESKKVPDTTEKYQSKSITFVYVSEDEMMEKKFPFMELNYVPPKTV